MFIYSVLFQETDALIAIATSFPKISGSLYKISYIVEHVYISIISFKINYLST